MLKKVNKVSLNLLNSECWAGGNTRGEPNNFQIGNFEEILFQKVETTKRKKHCIEIAIGLIIELK